MQAVCFHGVGQVRTVDIADPVIQAPRDAIVRVSMAGLCGSDLHPFWGRETGLTVGTVMGHELVGTIEAVGEAISDQILSVGDRVFSPFSSNCGSCYYCQIGLTARCTEGHLFGWRSADPTDLSKITGLHGCQSTLVRIPLADSTLKRLPDSLPDESGLLLGDNFSTAWYCTEMAEVRHGGVYVVVGCGTVGQLCVMSALAKGAQTVIALDPLETRRQQAESLGAIALPPEHALSAVNQRTDGRGVDAVMELVGLPDAQKLAWQLVRPGGVMSTVGCHCSPNFSFSPVDAYDKNLTYKTGRCSARHYMDVLTEKVVAEEFDLSSFVTHQFTFGESEKAYDVFSKRLDGCGKAVFVNPR